MRVLELAQIMAGPSCGALLADLGADVERQLQVQLVDAAHELQVCVADGLARV